MAIPFGDGLHEMSKHIFCGKQNITDLSSAELNIPREWKTLSMLKTNTPMKTKARQLNHTHRHTPERERETIYLANDHTGQFVLKFYGPVNPVESCRALSVYLTTSLQAVYQYCAHSFARNRQLPS